MGGVEMITEVTKELANNSIEIKGNIESKIYTGTGRRKVLIVEDVELNRDILSMILSEEYDVLTAENGEIGLELLAKHYRELSIVLLDMYMPVCDGFEFLRRSRADVLLSSVPVMVTTGSAGTNDEVKCLELGASDFITKPYNSRLVLSRIKSIIRLHESDATLAAIEYDELTGLYTRPAFNHYAEIMINNSGDDVLSMIVAEVENLNRLEINVGEKRCDEIIRYFGSELPKNADKEIIGFRKDNFLYFLLRADECDPLKYMDKAKQIEKASPFANVVMKYGFYFGIDKTAAITELCDRVRLTVESVNGSFLTEYAVYNDNIAKSELERFEMESSFEQAIANKEFVTVLQPKYDVTSERIVAAEALVRWKRSDGSMVSPGAFIPLFEKDGLIIRLDEYIFRHVCEIQKHALELGKALIRISVNLSRQTLISEDVAEKYSRIVREAGIPFDCISIELTESFAIENSRMSELAEKLVNAGFRLDMDDFGSGYSSMSSFVSLPLSVVKLDKSLIDRIGDKRGEIIIEYTIVIAHKLDMIVIAEGVERVEQLEFLRTVNCDLIQGFYFSPPVSEEKFIDMMMKQQKNNG